MWNSGKWGKHVENCYLRGFLRHLVPTFHASSYIDGTTHKSPMFLIQRISNVFSIHFSLWSDEESHHGGRWQKHWIYIHVSACIYSAISLIYSDIPAFILPQSFNESINGQLGFSQRIKTKQVFRVFDWKEDTHIEEDEEGKLIATRFILLW